MAVWQIGDEQWDDGLTFVPGEVGFTRDLAEVHADGQEVNYIGTPNWVPPPEPDQIDPLASHEDG